MFRVFMVKTNEAVQMKDPRKTLAESIAQAAPTDGLHATPIPGVRCYKFSKPNSPAKGNWSSSLSIVAQGQKEIALENNVYQYQEAYYIATPISLPVTSRIKWATPQAPFLALKIEIDPVLLAEVARKVTGYPSEDVQMRSYGIFTGKADGKMLESAVRLARLFTSPEDIPALAPLVIKEIFYHLLKGPNGRAIHQFTQAGSKLGKISQSIQSLRCDLTLEVDVTDLARQANMSRSLFFASFKEVTAMSPIQYQKRLRLMEARRMLIEDGESAEGAAFKVGYNSPSQFSREYSRMFGNSPLRDAMKVKKRGEPVPSI
jgi:AraC-like DNA-binding protein